MRKRAESTATLYDNKADRDRALAASYSFPFDEREPPEWMAGECEGEAERFWMARSSIPSGSLEGALSLWESKRYGRSLEPAAHGILWREVRRRLQGVRRVPPRANGFESDKEQQRYEYAVAQSWPPTHPWPDWIEQVIVRAGGVVGEGPRDMPEVFVPAEDDLGWLGEREPGSEG